MVEDTAEQINPLDVLMKQIDIVGQYLGVHEGLLEKLKRTKRDFNWIQKSTSSGRGQSQLALPGHSVQGSVGVMEYCSSVWLDCLKHSLV